MTSNAERQDMEVVPDEEGDADAARVKLDKLREELGQCRDERKEYLNGWQRAKADLINYKKDEAKRLEELARFATEDLIAEAVQVLDSFDLACEHQMPKEVERGIVLIRSQLEDILRKRGLEVVRPATGDEFNPAIHESLGESESETPDGTVAEALQPGYLLHGKVIRPARVKISKKPKGKG